MARSTGRASKLQNGLLGLAAASTAITLVACEPAPGINKTAYLLAVSGTFFAGVAQVAASVAGHAAGRKLVCATLAVAAGLTVASSLLQ